MATKTKGKRTAGAQLTIGMTYSADSLEDIAKQIDGFADVRLKEQLKAKPANCAALGAEISAYRRVAQIIRNTKLLGVSTYAVRTIDGGPVVGVVNADSEARAGTLARARFGHNAKVFPV